MEYERKENRKRRKGCPSSGQNNGSINKVAYINFEAVKDSHTSQQLKSQHLDTKIYPIISATLKDLVFLKLDETDGKIKVRTLCKALGLNYHYYRDTMYSYRSEWRSKRKNRQAQNALKFHNVRFWGYALKSLDWHLALTVSWEETKAKNRMIIWHDPKRIGRIEWFPSTGRINAWISKPASVGKMKQLLCNAFYITGLIFDINIFNKWANSFRLKGFHLVKDTGERLPYVRIGMLKDSNGVIVVMGDTSHPTSIELQVVYPDWAERNELLFNKMCEVVNLSTQQTRQFTEFMKRVTAPKPLGDRAREMFF